MRFVLAVLYIVVSASMAYAQTQPNLDRLSESQRINGGAASPEDKKVQSQSPGQSELTTGSGGASAANPQGGTPPNMQVAPNAPSKTGADQK